MCRVKFRSVVTRVKLQKSPNETENVTSLQSVHWKAELLLETNVRVTEDK